MEKEIIEKYIDACNDIIIHIKSIPQHTNSVALAERVFDKRNIGLEVYDSSDNDPCCFETVRLNNGRFEYVGTGDIGSEFHWIVRRETIESVSSLNVETLDGPVKIKNDCLVRLFGINLDTDSPDSCSIDSTDTKCGDLRTRYEELLEELSSLLDSRSRLVTSTRHSCLTDFVAGVAHEVNNPNGVIRGSADAADRCLIRIGESLERTESLDDLRQDKRFNLYRNMLNDNLALIKSASERLDKIVQSLKNFSRLDESECKFADVNEGLASVVDLMGHRLNGKIEIETKLEQLPQLKCHPSRLNQAFMNLLENSVNAIEERGRIEILSYFDEGNIVVRIVDNGRGIPKDDLDHLFKFGFRKTGTRVRIGTGLASTFSIVNDHGGDIEIDSEPGIGTRVTVRLPIGHNPC